MSHNAKKLLIYNYKPEVNKEYKKYKEQRMKLNVEGHADCISHESFQSDDGLKNNS